MFQYAAVLLRTHSHSFSHEQRVNRYSATREQVSGCRGRLHARYRSTPFLSSNDGRSLHYLSDSRSAPDFVKVGP
jgi:hypothetical protein